jgi:AcrR family transcriptional regulator
MQTMPHERAPASDAARQLPMLGDTLPLYEARPERADAAANRERILTAARRLFAERGAAAVSMDAVAEAAGVGKGTVFRRFGDRAGLTGELIDAEMRAFQEELLRGPPPLGPGAPAAQRLEAFACAWPAFLDRNLELALAAGAPAGGPAAPFASLVLHVRVLLDELRPGEQHEVLAEMIIAALGAAVVAQLRRERGFDLAELQSAALTLLRGVLGAETGRSNSSTVY